MAFTDPAARIFIEAEVEINERDVERGAQTAAKVIDDTFRRTKAVNLVPEVNQTQIRRNADQAANVVKTSFERSNNQISRQFSEIFAPRSLQPFISKIEEMGDKLRRLPSLAAALAGTTRAGAGAGAGAAGVGGVSAGFAALAAGAAAAGSQVDNVTKSVLQARIETATLTAANTASAESLQRVAQLQEHYESALTKTTATTGAAAAVTSRFNAVLATTAGRLGVVGLAAAALTAALLGVSKGIVSAAQAGRQLSGSTVALNTILGDASIKFRQLVGDSAKLGVGTTSLNKAIAPTAALLRTAGLEGDELAKSLDEVFRAAVDTGSVFGEEINVVLDAFGGAIRGETRSVERFGIAFSAATVETELLRRGVQKVNGEFSEQDKQLARVAILLQQADRFTGDFERTSGALGNQTKQLRAEMENLRAEISAQLLPAAIKITTAFRELVQDAGPAVVKMFRAIAVAADVAATAISAVSKAVGFLVKAAAEAGVGKSFEDEFKKVEDSFISFGERVDETARAAGTGFQQLFIDPLRRAFADRDLTQGLSGIFEGVIEQQEKLIAGQKLVTTAQERVASAHRSVAEAAKRVTDAQERLVDVTQSLADTKERLAERTQKLVDLEAERLTLINDTARDTRELEDAQRDLAKIGLRLLDIDQQRADVLQIIKDLETPASADELAEADRRIERAKIALNRARRAELELLKEINEEEHDFIDLSDLSLDQLRVRLSDIRASLAAQRAVARQTKSGGKTEIELEEERTLARLNVVDAEERLKKLSEDRLNLDRKVLNNAQEIERQTRKLVSLEFDKRRLLVDQGDAQRALNLLRAGETTRAKDIRTIDLQIVQAKKDQASAVRDVETATKNVKKANDDIKTAVIAVRDATILVRNANNDVRDAKAQQQLINAQILGTEKDINDALRARLGINASLVGQTADLLTQQLQISLPTLFPNNPFALNNPALARQLADAILNNPNRLVDLLRSLGSVGGFAEGGIVAGVNNKFGKLIRAGEHGRSEMVLPLQSGPQKVWELLSKNLPKYPSLSGGIAAIAAQQAPVYPKVGLPTSGVATRKEQQKRDKALAQAIVSEMMERKLFKEDVNMPIEINAAPGMDLESLSRNVRREVQKAMAKRDRR